MSGVANPVKMLMAKKVDLNRFMLKMIGNKVLRGSLVPTLHLEMIFRPEIAS